MIEAKAVYPIDEREAHPVPRLPAGRELSINYNTPFLYTYMEAGADQDLPIRTFPAGQTVLQRE